MIQTDLIAPIGQILKRHAAQRPEKLAFEDYLGKRINYSQLADQSSSLAIQLQELGMNEGDRVAILLPNSVDWVLSCLSIVRAGLVCVPISHDSVEAEIFYRLDDAECKAIVVSSHQLNLIKRICHDLPKLCHIIVADEQLDPDVLSLPSLCKKNNSGKPRDVSDIKALSFLVYTSGTTGRAKGVMLSQHSMLWVTAACWAPIAGLCEEDVVLSPLPLYHSYALNFSVLSVTAVGATEYLMEKYSTQEVLRQLNRNCFTLMPGVPTMFHYLLEGIKDSGPPQFSGIRYFLSAGAIMPAALNREFESVFGVPLLDGYGITETSTMVTMNWPGNTRVYGSCGLPLPGLATRIVNLQGKDVDFGEEGELIIRGPNVMLGYLNKPQDSASALKDGWYRTGDLAKSNENGFLTITGRLKELIIRGGQNIAPAEIEDTVLKHPDVLDCAAIGFPHPHLGEVPVVCVIPRQGVDLDLDGLRNHCAKLLSPYKVPHKFHVMDSIPRTGSGKIMRFQLRAALGNESIT